MHEEYGLIHMSKVGNDDSVAVNVTVVSEKKAVM